MDGRQRGFESDLPALAIQAFEQRGLFAADVSSRAHPNVQIKTFAAACDVRTQIALLPGDRHGKFERLEGVRVFRPHVDVAARSTHCDSRNGHPLDEYKRIAFHNHAIRKSTAVPLVRVADDVFLVGNGLKNRAPLNTGWETRASSTAQARIGNLFYDSFGCQRQGSLKATVASVAHIVG